MENEYSLNTFLHASKLNLNSKKQKWLILGNDSSDLDSVICCLTYGFYKQIKVSELYCVIPVICLPKMNINLKSDVILWLKQFNIDVAMEFVYLEDLISYFNDEQFCYNLKITLVDHHKPINDIFIKYVREVIDHRAVNYEFPNDQLEIKNIQLVGSCSTLIASYLLPDIEFKYKNTLLKLLHGVILLDTNCLAISNGKTTTIDVSTVENIENILSIDHKNRLSIYKLLVNAKSDVSHLTFDQKLKRDLKTIELQWKNSYIKIAIPTVIQTDVKDYLLIEDIENKLNDILIELDVNGIIILTCGSTIKRRGYLIFSSNLELSEKISNFLFSESALKLEHCNFNNQSNIFAFAENDGKTTRKLFIPIIENYFNRESAIFYKNQSNNCNIHLQIQDVDMNSDEEEVEREGAPYTLSTPLRSCSGSPNSRNSDMNLPSLNNRRTLALIDQKRQKHNADIDAVEDDSEDNKAIEEDTSPLAYTPENSDEEDTDFNSDHIGPLPSLNNKDTMENVKIKRNKLSELSTNGNSPVASENEVSFTPTNSISEAKGNKFSKEGQADNWNTGFNYLENQVDKKRQKLETSHLDSIANNLIKDALNTNENQILKQNFFQEILKNWSESYLEEEKLQFIKNAEADDKLKLAKLLTVGLMRDSLSNFEFVSLETNNSSLINEIDESNSKLSTKESSESEDENSYLPDSTIPDLEINYNSCPIGTIINKDNQGGSNCITSSGLDVENSSFNLYRRISTNNLDFSEDEKRLFDLAGKWCLDEDVIYSDCEQEPNPIIENEIEVEKPKKVIYPNKEITMTINKH